MSSYPPTFLPTDVLERSRDRERRARQRRFRGWPLLRWLNRAPVERRDLLVVALVLVSLWSLLAYTRVLDGWFDRFNNDRPDQLQAADALAGRR